MKTFKQFTEELKPIQGTQYGSNSGGIHIDTTTKEKHYIKKYKNPDQAKTEALTGKIYHHMGIHTVNPEMHGDSSIKSKWNEHLHTQDPKKYEKVSEKHANQLGKMYHAAILTKNWDIVGMEHDNVMHNKKTGDLHSIDHGGAFHFRAQGGHKDYGEDISEKKSLRNNENASGHVFNHAFKQHPNAEKHGLEAVKNMDMDHVHHLFKSSGLDNWKDLHYNFSKRRDSLLKSYS